MLVAFPQSWAGITTIVRCAVSLRTGSGGALWQLVTRYDVACIMMVTSYIALPVPVAAAATLGSTCGVSRPPSMVSTSAKVSSS